jgi:outer membrane lipoprotein-sorting protein
MCKSIRHPLVLSFIGLFLYSSTGLAKVETGIPLSLQEINKLQKDLNSGKHLSVEFEQIKYSHTRKKKRSQMGRAKFTQPDKFRWTLLGPNGIERIYDGKTLYSYDVEMKVATKYNPKGSTADELRSIVNVVLNLDSLLKRYRITSSSRLGDLVTLNLEPQGSENITASTIQLKVDTVKNYITYLKLDFTSKNYLEILFHSPSRAPNQDSDFQPPKGVKIVDSGL